MPFFEKVIQGHDAPDATGQQLLEFLHIRRCYFGILDAQIGHQGRVDIPLLIQLDRHLVDDLVAATLTHLGLDLLRLVRPHVVLSQHLLNRFQAIEDDVLIIRRAVHAQQILKNIHRHIRALLDELGQILADGLPGEVLVNQLIYAGIGGIRSHW